VVRVMVEHEDEVVCREVCEEVAAVVSSSSSSSLRSTTGLRVS
jgi:hypothetical protein